MVTIEPMRVELETEDDGRILASVPNLPGVMAYGADNVIAARIAKTIALKILVDMVENGEALPEPFNAVLIS